MKRETTARARLRLGPLFAERRYEWRDARGAREIALRFGVPVPDPHPGGDWLCPVQFAGAPAGTGLPRGVRPVYGVDGVQALSLAIGYARAELRGLQRSGRGELRWLDGSDLGLPDVLRLVGSRRGP